MTRFAGVTKPAAARGPATAPIIPGVAILVRLGLPEDASGSVSDKVEEFEGFAGPGAAEVVVGDLV